MMVEAEKEPPELLELRARPRPIRRLNRRMLMLGCAVAALIIAGATLIALAPPRAFKPGERSELYNTDRKQTADGLSKLPKSYDQLPPRLGPRRRQGDERRARDDQGGDRTPQHQHAPVEAADWPRPGPKLKALGRLLFGLYHHEAPPLPVS